MLEIPAIIIIPPGSINQGVPGIVGFPKPTQNTRHTVPQARSITPIAIVQIIPFLTELSDLPIHNQPNFLILKLNGKPLD